MGRHKTVSDEDVLAVARRIFREQGHAASTRDIARAAGVSQAVLYQRYGSKDELFFTSMAPSAPDLEEMLGPSEPEGDAHAYLLGAVERMAGYFRELLPIAIQVMMHPSFDPETLSTIQHVNAGTHLGAALARRLGAFERRGELASGSARAAAQLFTALAHDFGLRGVLAPADGAAARRELTEMIEVVWSGLAPSDRRTATPSVRSGRRPAAPRR
jgi:AcrR family transcriptional regulator